ncbi:MAG TPA: hypothetical protein VIL44_08060 [Micromonospora sp.]
MRVRLASHAAPGHAENEDAAVHHGTFVGVFDGVTALPGVPSGCAHGPAWYVRRLTTRLIEVVTEAPEAALADTLAEAIRRVNGDHGGRCDLANPATPAATVCLVRVDGEELEFLILSDSTLVVDFGGRVQAITDDRFARVVAELRGGEVRGSSSERDATLRSVNVRKHERTNRPGGYWVAAATPEAAYHAVTGRLPLRGDEAVRRAALLTDGASCAVDEYRLMDWPELLDLLTTHGPEELIRRVRAVEASDPDRSVYPRSKRHDDATAAICIFGQ